MADNPTGERVKRKYERKADKEAMADAAPPAPPPPPRNASERAQDAIALAKSQLQEAANAVSNPPSLPMTPAHNLLGDELRESMHPFSPEGNDIMPIRVEIDGAALQPPTANSYADTVLWNFSDSSFTPEAYAKISCDEGLPDEFVEPIAAQIRKSAQDRALALALGTPAPNMVPGAVGGAGSAAGGGVTLAAGTGAVSTTAGAAGPGAAATLGRTPERLVTLELHVQHKGRELRDRILWDAASTSPTAEDFARGLCTDLGREELQGAVALQIREQLRQLVPSDLPDAAASADRAERTEPHAVLRDEHEVAEWGPRLVSPDSVDV